MGDFLNCPKRKSCSWVCLFLLPVTYQDTNPLADRENCWPGTAALMGPVGSEGSRGKVMKRAGATLVGAGRGQRREGAHPCWPTQLLPGASASSCPPLLYLYPILSQGLTLVWACGCETTLQVRTAQGGGPNSSLRRARAQVRGGGVPTD